ncbi:MAG: Bug family tripartite tricarboxylate transporter substrate binding protein [Burkholderiales bacterium]
MVRLKLISVAALFVVTAAATGIVSAQQNWPTKPIRLIVVGAPGGSIDIPARIIAERMRDRIGQPIVVENRPQAGGTVGTDAVAKAAPDGYTLLWAFNGPLANAPHLYAKLPYSPTKDLTPIIMGATQPFVLAINAALPVNTVKELIEHARANPGKLNYSSLGNGSGSHLSMELMKTLAKIFVVHIPYNGAPAAATAVASGDVQATFLPPAVIAPHAQSGKVKLLAVSSAQRFPMMAELPTVAEASLPGFESDGWSGILAPAGTPREIVERLNKEVNQILASPEVRELLARSQIVAGSGTPEAFGQLIASESNKWAPIIRHTGAKLD